MRDEIALDLLTDNDWYADALGRVAELADAQASGACVRKNVGVQVPPRPLNSHRVGVFRFSRISRGASY